MIDQLVNAGLRRIRLTTGYASLHTQTFHTRFFIPKFFHIKTFHTQIFHTPDFSHPQFHTYFFIPRVFHTRDFSCPAFSDPFFSILLQLGAAIMVSMQILWHFWLEQHLSIFCPNVHFLEKILDYTIKWHEKASLLLGTAPFYCGRNEMLDFNSWRKDYQNR